MLVTVTTSALIDQLLTALSTTLVYSLLQGVALAAAGGLIILITGKVSPATRYNLLIGALVLFALGSAVTFGVQFNKLWQSAPVTFSNFSGQFDMPAGSAATPVVVAEKTNYLAELSAFVSAHHNTIVLIWFLIICIKAIQMGVGLQNVYRLKRTGTQPEPSYWPERMQQMAQHLGIRQKINLLESTLAKVPMVIGHFKPVILMPIGLLAALSTAEVEAILMHELAHIRRRDYLVNLLQSLVEVVFFFNPAVLWISQLIKIERENCCDDIALAQTNSKHIYIQALVTCEEYQQGKIIYAVAFSGRKNSLISRVKRMISNHNHGLNTFEKTLLTIFLVMSGVGLSAFAEKEAIKKTIHKVVKAISPKEEEPPVKSAPIAVVPVKQAPAVKVSEIAKEQPSHEELATAIKAVPPIMVPPVAIRDTNNKIIAWSTMTTAISTITSSKLNIKELKRQDSVDQIDARNLPVVHVIRQSPRIIMDEMVKDGLMEKGKFLPYSLSDREFKVNGIKQSDELARKYWLLKVGDPVLYAKAKEAEDRQRRMMKNAILLQMVTDKLIIENAEHLTFKLDNDEFVINGKKQPDDVFQKYLNEFVKKVPGGKMRWSYTNVIPPEMKKQ